MNGIKVNSLSASGGAEVFLNGSDVSLLVQGVSVEVTEDGGFVTLLLDVANVEVSGEFEGFDSIVSVELDNKRQGDSMLMDGVEVPRPKRLFFDVNPPGQPNVITN